MIDTTEERARFERWHRMAYPVVCIYVHTADGYTADFVNMRWTGWLAAKRDATKNEVSDEQAAG